MNGRFNYRHIICIFITIGFLACGVFVFPFALGRLIEGGRDFGLSVAYYFCEVFGIPHSITPTVNNLPQVPFFPSVPDMPSTPTTTLPNTWDGFKVSWAAYWRLWATMDNFTGYLSYLGNVLFTLCKVLVIALPFVLILYLGLNRYLKKQNNDYDKDSRPLKAFKWLTAHIYMPVKTWLIELYGFIRERRGYWVTWLCLWLYYFNAFTIVLEFLAFYFYFVMSFDVGNIYRQVYKLFLDLWTVIDFIPVWAWVIIGLIVFDRIRKNIA